MLRCRRNAPERQVSMDEETVVLAMVNRQNPADSVEKLFFCTPQKFRELQVHQ